MTTRERQGFEEVVVPDGRRGLWVRRWVSRDGREIVDEGRWLEQDAGQPCRLDLAAGREGDDAEVTVRLGDVIDVRTLVALGEVVDALRWAHEVAGERAEGAEERLDRIEVMLETIGDGKILDEARRCVLVVRNALRMLARVRRAVTSL